MFWKVLSYSLMLDWTILGLYTAIPDYDGQGFIQIAHDTPELASYMTEPFCVRSLGTWSSTHLQESTIRDS